jgi:hypothetical protein
VRYATGGSAATATAAQTRFVPATLTGLPFDYFQHEARLSGLLPQTSYDYTVFSGGSEAASGRDRFVTAPPVGSGTVRFVAFGDSGVGSAEQRQLGALIATDAFDLSLHGGDVAYGSQDTTGGGDYRQFEDWVFGVYGSWMRSRPFFPAIGNHDDEVRSAAPYRDVFVLPENGASIEYPDHAERFYSFDHGPVHFVALDTELAFADPARRAAQIAWLRADLASTSQPWRVVYLHRPPYSAGTGHGSDLAVRQAFAPIFEEHGVQLVISAHEHNYERTTPIREYSQTGGGVTYVVSGGGGARLYAAGQAWWTAASASVHHYVRATAGDCVMSLQAVRIDGAVFDSFELNRCAAPPPPTAETTAALSRTR